jgi:hypothetical protein
MSAYRCGVVRHVRTTRGAAQRSSTHVVLVSLLKGRIGFLGKGAARLGPAR